MTRSEPALVLTAPAAVGAVAVEQASGLVPLENAQKAELAARARRFVAELETLDVQSPEFGEKAEQLGRIGRREVAESAGGSLRSLDRPIRAMATESSIVTDLAALRRIVEDLDPGRRDLLSPRKLLGLLPFGSKLPGYFESYQSAQPHIASILTRLSRAKDELLRDNAAIDVERQALWAGLGRLEQVIHVARTLDTQLDQRAGELEAAQPARAKALREGPLFNVRQRAMDLLTQLAVTMQGYLALDLVKKNNLELIKGVERASTTTVSALRTAVTVAQALTRQKLVLRQINALGGVVSDMVESTAEAVHRQGSEIQARAASPSVPLETLQRAFQGIFQTMDTIDTFKTQALESLQATIDSLGAEVERSRGRLARAEPRLQPGADDAGDPFPASADSGR